MQSPGPSPLPGPPAAPRIAGAEVVDAPLAAALFEQSPFSTVVYDPAGHPLAANGAFRELWGVGLEAVPASYTVLDDPELAAQGVLPLVRRAFAGEVVRTPPVRYDISRVATGGGRVTWTEGHFYPVRGEDGTLTHVLLTHVDVSDSLAAREQAEQQAVELEIQAEQLQEQAAEREEQQERLRRHAEELGRVNEALREANERLAGAGRKTAAAERDVRAILESISDPFVVHDAGWRFQYVNEAAASIFRGPDHELPGSVLGRVVWEVYPELAGSATQAAMRRAAEEREPVVEEVFYPRLGTWSEIRCYPLSDGRLATSWKDVTARRRTEEAARYLARASAILGASLDYGETLSAVARLVVPELADWCTVHLVADDGSLSQLAVAHADPERVEFARAFGARYPADADAASGVAAVVRTGEPALFPEITDEMLVASARDAEHLRVLRETGMTSVMIVPICTPERVMGALSLVAAESGRRYGDAELELAGELGRRAGMAVENARLYAEARDARAEAEAANRSKSQFLANMSHELRTPLNAIGGYVELLRLGIHGPVTPAQEDALARVTRAQAHLLGLINDVLNFARIEAGRTRFDLGAVAVEEAAAEVESLLAPQAAARGIRLSRGGEPAGAAVRADAEKLQQVLINLLSNALKFTDPGGSAALEWEEVEERVEIRVRDTGIGIPPESLEAIFDPFVQVTPDLARARQGTGLGLAISRELARGMGGDLWARSAPGEGSTFTLALPRAQAPGG